MNFGPWSEVAARHGFGLLERRENVLHLISGATFLDLTADGATVKTWLDAGADRWALTTFGVHEPRPRPPGAAGWLAARVVGMMQRMVPAGDRPVPLRSPEDLGALIEKHLQELLAVAGKPVTLSLQQRLDQEARDGR